jgi:biopolymer transport protein ExbD
MTVQLSKGNVLDKLNLTPMIDVVFLLLIFFTIATRFESDERELSVVLPEASEAMPMTKKTKDISVNVDANGQVVIQGEVLTLPELRERLQQASVNNPGRQRVIVYGDHRVPYEHVAAVFDLCAATGCEAVPAAQPKE